MSEKALKGIIVCSGEYTSDAISFSQKNNIDLITGRELAGLISAVQKRKRLQVPKKGTACPLCGSYMVHRLAKRGRNAGSSFMGCSKYPNCRGTRS